MRPPLSLVFVNSGSQKTSRPTTEPNFTSYSTRSSQPHQNTHAHPHHSVYFPDVQAERSMTSRSWTKKDHTSGTSKATTCCWRLPGGAYAVEVGYLRVRPPYCLGALSPFCVVHFVCMANVEGGRPAEPLWTGITTHTELGRFFTT